MANIVVMGGSFNPPTVAHYRLMAAALDATGARKGVFVPVSDPYLRRKMRKSADARMCLPAALRVKMLRAMCADDARMEVSEIDLGNVRSRTCALLSRIQEEYPDCRIIFACGADKLPLVDAWAARGDFLSRFGVALFSRDGAAPAGVRAEAIVPIAPPEGVQGVSATRVRNAFLKGEAVGADVHPAVREMLSRLSPKDFPGEICRFRGEYAFLRNDYPAEFSWRGRTWRCAEAAFQASKCQNPKQYAGFSDADAAQAKKRAAKIAVYPGWEAEKEELMREILAAKFARGTLLAACLTETGAAVLIAGNHGNDRYWGVDSYTGAGENRLGRILMEIRARLLGGTVQ